MINMMMRDPDDYERQVEAYRAKYTATMGRLSSVLRRSLSLGGRK